MATAVAAHYARALADLAVKPASGLQPETAVAQIASFADLVRSSSGLRNLLLSPAVSSTRKRDLVRKLAETLELHPLVRNFLFVIMERRRIGMLDEIREALEHELDERLGIVRAHVTSAMNLTGESRTRLAAELERVTGRQVRVEYAVDESLIGGAVTRIGSTVYDGSVKGQLENLRQRLSAD